MNKHGKCLFFAYLIDPVFRTPVQKTNRFNGCTCPATQTMFAIPRCPVYICLAILPDPYKRFIVVYHLRFASEHLPPKSSLPLHPLPGPHLLLRLHLGLNRCRQDVRIPFRRLPRRHLPPNRHQLRAVIVRRPLPHLTSSCRKSKSTGAWWRCMRLPRCLWQCWLLQSNSSIPPLAEPRLPPNLPRLKLRSLRSLPQERLTHPPRLPRFPAHLVFRPKCLPFISTKSTKQQTKGKNQWKL